ncbi:UNVERIFIED_CONTAM: hypothetical protein FKN15_019282 [Acipenser sinensis]
MVTTTTPHRVTTGSGKSLQRPGSFNRILNSINIQLPALGLKRSNLTQIRKKKGVLITPLLIIQLLCHLVWIFMSNNVIIRACHIPGSLNASKLSLAGKSRSSTA